MKPVVIKVLGDINNPEPQHHRIEFPGGSICVDRCDDGTYWAHISLAPLFPRTHIGQATAKVIGSRIDFDYETYRERLGDGLAPIPEIPDMSKAQHVAVRFELVPNV